MHAAPDFADTPAAPAHPERQQKPLDLETVAAPPPEARVRRAAVFAAPGEKRTRYTLPASLDSSSPVGYRTRLSMTPDEVRSALALLSLERPTGFAPRAGVREAELFEEASLGLLLARQSTNYRGHRQVTLGPEDADAVALELARLTGLEAPVLGGASHVHLVLSRPYRTPFTLLLTLVGHPAIASPFTVLKRIWDKRVNRADDIPTIGYLQHLHLGVLADGLERAAVVASGDRRRAQIFQAPFCGKAREANAKAIRALEARCGLTLRDRADGWRLALVAQVGQALPDERAGLDAKLCRRLGANLVALRSERIQPGVNHEPAAPEQYRKRQEMDVPDELTTQAGRAAYNAFAHWTGCDRERAKDLLLLERIDVLTPNGKERLREVRDALGRVTDRVVRDLPLWADLPTGKAFSRNAERGRKAFALAGQRIYVAGLARADIEREGLDWELAVRGVGAAAARGALYAELCGLADLPPECDLLAGTCLMAGPVNQNDVGKTFYGEHDLLEGAFPGRGVASLLVWTLKAKTVADPIGNEEQLLNPARKGALVDLRPGPHEVIRVARRGALEPMRQQGGRRNAERAFGDLENFVTDAVGRGIPGNRGAPWPAAWRDELVWPADGSAHADA